MDIIFYIIIVVLVIWYFGSPINNILQSGGLIASKEFEYYSDEQDFNLAKRYNRLYKAVEDADLKFGKSATKEALAKLNGHQHTDDK